MELIIEDDDVVLPNFCICTMNIGCRTDISTLKGAQDLGKSKENSDDQRYGKIRMQVSISCD